MSNEPSAIGISLGDPNGIGPEIIAKSLLARVPDENRIVVFGDAAVFSAYNLHLPKDVELVSIDSSFRVRMGETSADAGRYAMKSLEKAVQYAKNGLIQGFVTAPISKESVNLAGWHIPGHTEWLAEQFSSEVLMILASEKLKVALVTGHVPLRRVAELITADRIISTVVRFEKALRKDFKIKRPSIAIFGLNPHAGDGGVLGMEEIDIIKPAVESLNQRGILCAGPFASDGFFGNQSYLSYDGVVAMYHDQGLSAFKAISFGDGVNITAGLPIVRTSPDHGTAFAISGQNKADASSFSAALAQATALCRNRRLS